MNHLSNANQQTMSSREIAELVESRHDSVKRTVERLIERGVIVQPPLVDEPDTDAMGRPRTTSVYRLCKRDSYVVVAQLSPEFTARLVDRWQELEAQSALPSPINLSRLQLIEIAMQAEQERLELERKVTAYAPKVEFHDRVTAASGEHTIDQAAKMLGTGQRRLFNLLRERHILRKDNLPYQQYVDRGLFRVAEKPFKDGAGRERLSVKTVVTGRGLVHLQQMLASGSLQQQLRV